MRADGNGLAEILAGTAEAADCIVAAIPETFDFLPAGRNKERLDLVLGRSSALLNAMIDRLSSTYEVVILDLNP